MKNFIVLMNVCLAFFLLSNCSNKSKKEKVENDSEIIVEIPDANFKAYLLANFDANKDGEISLAEAKAVKEINCSGKNIQKLDGIEKFKNLEKLDCSNNQLIELDVRYNKKINRLICTGNPEGMFLYVGYSSPLRNKNFQKPVSNVTPGVTDISRMLDISKCTYDWDKTNISVSFDD